MDLSSSDLDIIAGMDGGNALEQTSEATDNSTTQPAAEAPPAPQPEQPKVDPNAIELERLRRVIATDPNLRQRYEAEKYREYGVPYEPVMPQQQQQQQEAQMLQAQQLPFEKAEYDPFNPDHQLAMIQYQLSQSLQPFQQWLQQQQQEAQMLQAQQQQMMFSEREALVQNTLDKLVPGLKSVFETATPNATQRAVQTFAKDLFIERMQQMPSDLWLNEKVITEVVNQIAPEIKEVGARLGLFQSQSPANAPVNVRTQELYVEGGNAVPADTGNAFDKAFARGDVTGMVSALGL